MATTFDLKGSLFTLTILKLKSPDLELLQKELGAKIAEAPAFFEHAPIVIDLQPLLQSNPPIDFLHLATLLRSFSLVPVGVRHGSPHHLQAAVAAGFARFPSLNAQDTAEDRAPVDAAPTAKSRTAPLGDHKEETPAITWTRVITQPVRSGKQVYAQGGDLLILSSVSPGAEVLADGNIHVYGPLRGRALAGVRGNTKANIFCRQLEAELISIAGHYKISEEITHKNKDNDQLKHIYLEEDDIKVALL